MKYTELDSMWENVCLMSESNNTLQVDSESKNALRAGVGFHFSQIWYFCSIGLHDKISSLNSIFLR
jgi:hypothetical protein